jgi:hypothetical protein
MLATSLIMYRNIGNNSFERLPNFNFPFISSRFFIVDFNNDSLQDVLFQFSDKSGYVIYYNQNNFKLTDSLFVAVPYFGEWWRNCHCADVDGNGYTDILTIRNSSVQLPANIDIKYNDGKGHFVEHPLEIKDGNNLEEVHLFKNYPNPFCNQTTIEFYISKTTLANLSIYDTKGNFITCLVDKRINAGLQHAIWNRIDRIGETCKSGIYFAVLKTAENGSQTIKLITYQ